MAVLEACSKLVGRYESDRMLCQANLLHGAGRQCDTLVYGCLIKGLKKLRLWPGPISPGDVHVSLTQLVGYLNSMTCLVLDGNRENAHARCVFTRNLRAKIDSIELDISSATDVPLRKHMDEQAKK